MLEIRSKKAESNSKSDEAVSEDDRKDELADLHDGNEVVSPS